MFQVISQIGVMKPNVTEDSPSTTDVDMPATGDNKNRDTNCAGENNGVIVVNEFKRKLSDQSEETEQAAKRIKTSPEDEIQIID